MKGYYIQCVHGLVICMSANFDDHSWISMIDNEKVMHLGYYKVI